jgi:hypothetical protein
MAETGTKKTRMETHPCFLNLTISIFYEKKTYLSNFLTKVQWNSVNTSQPKLKNVKPSFSKR